MLRGFDYFRMTYKMSPTTHPDFEGAFDAMGIWFLWSDVQSVSNNTLEIFDLGINCIVCSPIFCDMHLHFNALKRRKSMQHSNKDILEYNSLYYYINNLQIRQLHFVIDRKCIEINCPRICCLGGLMVDWPGGLGPCLGIHPISDGYIPLYFLSSGWTGAFGLWPFLRCLEWSVVWPSAKEILIDICDVRHLFNALPTLYHVDPPL